MNFQERFSSCTRLTSTIETVNTFCRHLQSLSQEHPKAEAPLPGGPVYNTCGHQVALHSAAVSACVHRQLDDVRDHMVDHRADPRRHRREPTYSRAIPLHVGGGGSVGRREPDTGPRLERERDSVRFCEWGDGSARRRTRSRAAASDGEREEMSRADHRLRRRSALLDRDAADDRVRLPLPDRQLQAGHHYDPHAPELLRRHHTGTHDRCAIRVSISLTFDNMPHWACRIISVKL